MIYHTLAQENYRSCSTKHLEESNIKRLKWTTTYRCGSRKKHFPEAKDVILNGQKQRGAHRQKAQSVKLDLAGSCAVVCVTHCNPMQMSWVNNSAAFISA